MSTSDELKKIVTMARPLIEQALDLTEELGAIRQAATDKGIDWLPLRSLLKAQVQDERDGGTRVDKLIERADHSASYASLLGVSVEMKCHLPAATEKAADAPSASSKPSEATQAETNVGHVSGGTFDNGGIPPGFERTAKVPA